MWPPSAQQGIKKMRSYQKKKRTIEDIVKEEELNLLLHLLIRPSKMQNTLINIQTLSDRDPIAFFKGTIKKFYITIKTVNIVIQKAHLKTIEHSAL